MSSERKKVSVYFIFFIVLLYAGTVLADQPVQVPGITCKIAQEKYFQVDTRIATSRPVGQRSILPGQIKSDSFIREEGSLFELDEWILLESLSGSYSIPPGDHYALRLDLDEGEVTHLLPENELSSYTLDAIERAPAWIRNDLLDNMIQFGNWQFLQDGMAQIIIEAEDPYVDEIAFVMAHISPAPLINGRMSWDFSLFVENVEDVYAADEYLDYVQINDYGSTDDDDYWSTAEYRIVTEDGDTTSIEIDRELYYWYVVHPRISDEVPKYIDPDNGNSANPPTGKFWRDYFLNEPDDDYQSLRDMLDGCEIMYGNLINDRSDNNGAIGRVTQWILDVMEFNARQELSIQPVRIYSLHLGLCGEHQDITAAAARAALIPAVGSCMLTEDHVWNEFWGGEGWVSWEPVNTYIGNSLVYEQGWGRIIPTVFNWRGDGWIWTVTERYRTESTTLNVQVLDREDNLVDGAKVKLYSEYLYGGIRFAAAGYTDCDGNVTFNIGGGRNFYLNISSTLGNYPVDQDQVTQVIEDSDPDVEYDWEYNYNSTINILEPDEAQNPNDPVDHFHLSSSCSVQNEATYGQFFQDADFVAEVGEGVIQLFVCDEENYELFCESEEYEAFSIFEMRNDAEDLDFTFPRDGTWYTVFNNTNSTSNYQRVDFNVDLFIDDAHQDVASTDAQIPRQYALMPNFPNPFNAQTKIRFDLAKSGDTNITVYNLNGQELIRRPLGGLNAGRYEIFLDLGKTASGTYLYMLESGNFNAAGRMVFLK
ncbi:T9SS type A sorting domain-containing protein [Calditrichota bacterium]